MAEKINYKKSTSKPGEIDTKLGALVSKQLKVLYEQEFKESWEKIKKVNIKKFAQFIGKIFDITVPDICIVKAKKIEKVFKDKDILGACIMEGKHCKEIWLQKEIVKEGDGQVIYFLLLHELRHCWQGKKYTYYYGEKEDTKELEMLREADACAFAELIVFYLFECWYSNGEENTIKKKELRRQIEATKNEIRVDLWKQIGAYYSSHGRA